MEYALEEITKRYRVSSVGLNPCSNGICSRSSFNTYNYGSTKNVLILVLMEYALEAQISHLILSDMNVLILVLMEYALEGIRQSGVSLSPHRS